VQDVSNWLFFYDVEVKKNDGAYYELRADDGKIMNTQYRPSNLLRRVDRWSIFFIFNASK